MAPAKLQPAALGGAFIGVLSALPIVSAGNVCCCLWLVLGGVLAAYVMQQNHPEPVTAGDGAAAGFLAAIIGALIYVIVAGALVPILAPLQQSRLEQLLADTDVPPEFRDMLERFSRPGVGVAVGFVTTLFFGMVFSTLGGLLGAVIFRKKALPPPAPPPPPSYYPPAPPSPPAPPAPPSGEAGSADQSSS